MLLYVKTFRLTSDPIKTITQGSFYLLIKNFMVSIKVLRSTLIDQLFIRTRKQAKHIIYKKKIIDANVYRSLSMRCWYLSHMRAVKTLMGLRICAVTPESLLLPQTKKEYTWKHGQNCIPLVPPDSDVCVFKV